MAAQYFGPWARKADDQLPDRRRPFRRRQADGLHRARRGAGRCEGGHARPLPPEHFEAPTESAAEYRDAVIGCGSNGEASHGYVHAYLSEAAERIDALAPRTTTCSPACTSSSRNCCSNESSRRSRLEGRRPVEPLLRRRLRAEHQVEQRAARASAHQRRLGAAVPRRLRLGHRHRGAALRAHGRGAQPIHGTPGRGPALSPPAHPGRLDGGNVPSGGAARAPARHRPARRAAPRPRGTRPPRARRPQHHRAGRRTRR